MNEMMTALEAMIRRVVKEELDDPLRDNGLSANDFKRSMKNYVDNHKHEFAAIVSQGALDQPWFDDAIKAEVAEAVVPAAGFTFADRVAFETSVIALVRLDPVISDWVHSKAVDAVTNERFTLRVT